MSARSVSDRTAGSRPAVASMSTAPGVPLVARTALRVLPSFFMSALSMSKLCPIRPNRPIAAVASMLSRVPLTVISRFSAHGLWSGSTLRRLSDAELTDTST